MTTNTTTAIQNVTVQFYPNDKGIVMTRKAWPQDLLARRLERRQFREHRPAAAAHGSLLTNLRIEDLRHGA